MSARVEQVTNDEPIDVVLRRLIDGVRASRGLERITVVTPTNQASFYIRRSLAKGGLFNVDFKRLEDVAELLAGSEFDKPHLHDLQASEFVYQVARDHSLGDTLGGHEVTPQLQSALHSTFRELELLDESNLASLSATNKFSAELVGRFRSYMGLASNFRHGAEVAKEAARLVDASPDHKAVRSLGTLILVEASRITPVQRPLFDALAKLNTSVTVRSFLSRDNHSEFAAHNPGQGGVKAICVPDVSEEIKDVVREIVSLAKSGAKFSRMAVVFEDESYSGRVAESLEFAGIPVSGPDRSSLSESPEGRFISGALNVFSGEFSRADLTAWISSAPVKDPSTGKQVPAARWDAITRKAGVTVGVEESWIPRLERFARNIERRAKRFEQLEEGQANQVSAAALDAEFATRLKDFVVDLNKRAPGAAENSWIGFTSWLQGLIADYFVPSDDDSNNRNYARVTSLIDRLASLDSHSPNPEYAHCVTVMREQMDRRSAGLRSLGSGVYVGPVWTAAGCPFDAVFVVGMSEGRYPSAGVPDPLLPDPVKRSLDTTGTLLSTVDQRIESSRVAFTSVVGSATNVFFYWPIGIPGEAREFGPARWFLDAVRMLEDDPLLPAGSLLGTDVGSLTIRKRFMASGVESERAGDPHEYDVTGAREWGLLGGDATEFPLAGQFASMEDSIKLETSRESSDWTEFDGNIGQLIGGISGSDSSSDEGIGSATAFETYAACPYRFFLSRRLHVEPTESPEPEITLDALSFGTLIHDVLEEFALWRMKDETKIPSASEQESWLHEATVNAIDKLKVETPGRSDGAWQIETSRAWLVLRQWLRRERRVADLASMRQVEAEYSFGGAGGGQNSGPAVEIKIDSGRVVRFRGQVDRVDISNDGGRIVVYDYKSGGNSAYSKLDSDPIKRGTKLQLPLYSKAVSEKYPDADIFAAYWFVRENSNELKPDPGDYQSDRAESALTEAVATIVDGIDNGVFPARPGNPASWGESSESFENCLYCEYARVCPKSKARLWHTKKVNTPTLQKYVELSEGDQ